MGKTLFHSELVMCCQGGQMPATLTIKSALTKSKFPEKPDYFNVELNGEGRYLQPETPQISADLGAYVGRMIVATFTGDREQSLMVIQGQQGMPQPAAQPQAYQQPPPPQQYHQSGPDVGDGPDRLGFAQAATQPPPQQQPAAFEQQSAMPAPSSDPKQAAIILQQGMNLYWKIFARVQNDAKTMDGLGFSLTTEELKCAVATMFIFATRHEREGLSYSHSVHEAMPRGPVWPDSIAEQ